MKQMKIIKDFLQGSPEWLKARAGVLTGTMLKKIMSGKFKKDGEPDATMLKAMRGAMYELLGGEFSYDENAPEIKNYLMNAGNELEPIAKAKYEDKTGNKVTEVGMVKKNDWLGLSPDGLIESDKTPEEVYNKGVEFKCPLGNDSAKFFKYMFEGIDAIKNDTDKYIWQIVHYFIVIDTLEELDFVIYNPNIVKDKQLYIITITREDIKEEIEEAQKRILVFRKIWEEHIVHLI